MTPATAPTPHLPVAAVALQQPGLDTRLDRTGLLAWQEKRVRALVETGLRRSMPVHEMAVAVRLSPSYFSRAFAQSFGCTPHAYVTAQRIARAKTLLRETDDSLADVALACGLADQSHLSRMFRRYVGCTPRTWRRAPAADHSPSTDRAAARSVVPWPCVNPS